MNQRKDTYRAALQRSHDVAAPRSAKSTTLHTRYVRVTIEVDPALTDELTRWTEPPVAALVRAANVLLRPLGFTQDGPG
ncbi:hypothetical protein [Streptomyces cadmiisoli]|uniref:hypothetical protein n=1 Tax=Streptomyces cadmiisoli TaxID=2184053 RepID=UPI00364FB7F4